MKHMHSIVCLLRDEDFRVVQPPQLACVSPAVLVDWDKVERENKETAEEALEELRASLNNLLEKFQIQERL